MIGIFDSGIGGLTVVRALRQLDPKLDILYLGDTARLPYGTKSSETIKRYAIEDARYLVNAGATVLVVACNTMSAVAIEVLKKAFPHIPLFEVITPAVQDALTIAGEGIIGVIGTRATINSGIYERLLQNPPPYLPLLLKREEKNRNTPFFDEETKNNFLPLKPGGGKVGVRVLSRACPLFVPLVEEGWATKSETKRIAKHYLHHLKTRGVKALILGCTHYPFLRDVIQHVMGRRVKLIDPAETTARAVAAYLQAHQAIYKQCHNAGKLTVCLTDQTPHITTLAQQWLNVTSLKTVLAKIE